RLLLRAYILSDAPTLSTSFNNNRQRLKQDFPGRSDKIWTKEEAESFIWQKNQEWERRESFHIGIWDKTNRMYAGEISYKDIAWKIPKADVGYYVLNNFEGKGIITEALTMTLPFAFEILEMQKLQIRCSSEHIASQRVAEKCGFKPEGVLRNDFVSEGRTLVTLVYYGMTPADYRALNLKPPLTGGII
ncbi:MAG: GNAT family protein, partial [bacterium]